MQLPWLNQFMYLFNWKKWPKCDSSSPSRCNIKMVKIIPGNPQLVIQLMVLCFQSFVHRTPDSPTLIQIYLRSNWQWTMKSTAGKETKIKQKAPTCAHWKLPKRKQISIPMYTWLVAQTPHLVAHVLITISTNQIYTDIRKWMACCINQGICLNLHCFV